MFNLFKKNIRSDTVFIDSPYDEFSEFIKFNSRVLYELKKKYKTVITAAPLKAACILTEADIILSVSNQYLDSRNVNYPQILEVLGRGRPRYKLGYIKSGFRNLVNNYLKIHYSDCVKLSFSYGQDYELFKRRTRNFSLQLNEDYLKLKIWLENTNNYVIPYKEEMEFVKQNFSKFIPENKKTFVIITRNFTKKQPQENSGKVDNLIQLINYLTEKDIYIINIGFPPYPMSIKNANYKEVNTPMSYGEMIAFIRLTSGMLITGQGGATWTHLATDLNVAVLSSEWTETNLINPISFCDVRRKKKDLVTWDFKEMLKNGEFEKIYSHLRNSPPHRKISGKKNNIIILDQI